MPVPSRNDTSLAFRPSLDVEQAEILRGDAQSVRSRSSAEEGASILDEIYSNDNIASYLNADETMLEQSRWRSQIIIRLGRPGERPAVSGGGISRNKRRREFSTDAS
jgi:hypothetical protein